MSSGTHDKEVGPMRKVAPSVLVREELDRLLREMVRSFAEGLMSAEADVVCGAPYGEASPGADQPP